MESVSDYFEREPAFRETIRLTWGDLLATADWRHSLLVPVFVAIPLVVAAMGLSAPVIATGILSSIVSFVVVLLAFAWHGINVERTHEVGRTVRAVEEPRYGRGGREREIDPDAIRAVEAVDADDWAWYEGPWWSLPGFGDEPGSPLWSGWLFDRQWFLADRGVRVETDGATYFTKSRNPEAFAAAVASVADLDHDGRVTDGSDDGRLTDDPERRFRPDEPSAGRPDPSNGDRPDDPTDDEADGTTDEAVASPETETE